MKDKNKEEIARFYDEQWRSWDNVYEGRYDSEYTSPEVFKRRDIILYFVDEYACGRTLRTIDVGCGTGVLLCDVLKRGHYAVGVDISAKMVGVTREKANYLCPQKDFCVQGDIEYLPFVNESFDVVVCAGVLSHQKDDDKTLYEIRRIIKTGGLVVVTLPNAFKLRNLLDPYSYLVAIFRCFSKLFSFRTSSNPGALGFLRGGTFTLRKYHYLQLRHLFKAHGLIIKGIKGCDFGPFTFFRKPIFTVEYAETLSDRIEKLARRRVFRFLNCFANTFVLRLEKNV